MKGRVMTPSLRYHSRILIAATLTAMSVLWTNASVAQNAEALPSYVTAEFGTPPAIPKGRLSREVKAAVQTAFIDAMTQPSWGGRQQQALQVIAQSKDCLLYTSPSPRDRG